MSLPVRQNIVIYKGSTFAPEVFNVKDEDGAAVDLTGYLVYSEVRSFPDDPNAYDLAPEITDEATGEITIRVSDEDTDAIEAGRYEWDLIIENPSGERLVVRKGTATVQGLATQP